jgi:acyl-[acyl-carrier-protein]-phospholipid O-acyltransferase/long-chain-fatty-acid--[acyl-carrier-protein] ligase
MIKLALRWLTRLLMQVRIDAPPAAPEGPVLYAANHPRALDALLLSLFLPGDAMVLVPREDLRGRAVRWLLRFRPHQIAEMNDPASIKRVLRMLSGGQSVVLYPQGRAFETRCVMKVYEVPAIIAARSGVPVVPVRIEYHRGLRTRVRIRTYAPAHIAHAASAAPRQRRLQAAEDLQRVLEMAAFHDRARVSLFEAFLDAVHEQGRRTFIIEDLKEQPRTYNQVLKGALMLGRLLSRGTAKGENVGVLLPNAVPTVCTVLGLTAFGRVPAMLNYSAGPAAVQSACVAARVHTVITSRAFVEQGKLEQIVAAISDLRLIYLEDLVAGVGLADKLWLMLFALWWPRRVIDPGVSTGPAVVSFTSGSEARPKGVVLSHEGILANICQLATAIDFTPSDKVLNPLPVYHSYSFTAGVMLCLLTGTKLFLYVSPLRYRAIPEIAYRRNCTYLFGTSTFLSYYARHADNLDFYSVRRVISGGEKLGTDVARIWEEKFGLRIYQGYGATECSPVIALSTPHSFKPGTVGRLLPGLDHRIEPVAGIERGGLLHLKGVQVMLGYYRYENPGVIEPPRSVFGDGWYNTGDIVDSDPSQILTVVGRVKRFAKIAGEMVSLDVIEEIARTASPDFAHAAVLRTEASSGETIVLFTTDPDLGRSQLVRMARQLGRQELAVAKRIVWMPEIPLLATGKTDYVALETLQVAANSPDAGPDGEDDHRPSDRQGEARTMS